uniref:Uncharacterized protein n=2 Tax=Meloidogyne TaxID=189290 RepID=A0A6V7WWJ6_MELEN|nr:unnamed protein product [Meloidogyne enterolobii]CAD2191147.1 unnamed protein product [Meloidogyne enterolobii]
MLSKNLIFTTIYVLISILFINSTYSAVNKNLRNQFCEDSKPIIDAHLRGCVENQLIKLGDCCFGHYSFNRPPYTAAQLNANFCPCIKKAFPHKYQGCEANIYNTFSC